jgi:hypothetical protein
MARWCGVTGDHISRTEFASFAVIACAFALAAIAMGVASYASLRRLRQLPDFPEKPAMLRGAKWGELVVGAWLAASVTLFGVLHRSIDPYVLTGFLQYASFWGGLTWLGLRFEMESEGMTADSSMARVRPFDLDKWLSEVRGRHVRSRKWDWVYAACAVAALAGYIGAQNAGYHDMIRRQALEAQNPGQSDIARQEPLDARAADLGARLQARMGVSDVDAVVAMGPTVSPGPVYLLYIYAWPGVPPESAAAMADRAREALAVVEPPLCWRIIVTPKFGAALDEGYYVPRGMTLPPVTVEGSPPRHPPTG